MWVESNNIWKSRRQFFLLKTIYTALVCLISNQILSDWKRYRKQKIRWSKASAIPICKKHMFFLWNDTRWILIKSMNETLRKHFLFLTLLLFHHDLESPSEIRDSQWRKEDIFRQCIISLKNYLSWDWGWFQVWRCPEQRVGLHWWILVMAETKRTLSSALSSTS